MNLSMLNARGAELRARWLPNPPGENDMDAAFVALNKEREAHVTTVRMWRTAQLTDGRIVGCFGDAPTEQVVSLAFWWGVDLAWLVDDPDCLIFERYKATVSIAGARDAVWPVADAPVEYPVPVGESLPESVPVALFDF